MTLQRRTGWGRTRLVAAASAMAFAVTVATGTSPSGAQESGPPAETGEIRNGTAEAVARIAKIAPGVGQLELAMTTGVSISQMTNFLAQSSSQAGDLGLIGTSLTGEGCDGGDPTITPGQLPQPTVVDNRSGDAEATRDEAGSDGSPAGSGRMYVSAQKDPPATVAETTATAIDIAGVLEFGGGKSRTEARALPGEGREAIARSEGDLALGGGAVQLSGMVWHASHRTGVDPLVEAGFDVGQATVGGLPFDASQTEALESAANTALAPLGITLTFPRVVHYTMPNELIQVTPMRIELRDTPVGKTVLGPVLDATREQRGNMFDQLVEISCDLAGVLLVADVVISVVSGTGFTTIELGGVNATSADLEVFDPFGDIGSLPPVVDLPPSVPTSTNTGGLPSGPTGSLPNPSTSGPTQIDVGDTAPVAAGPIEELCESIHPNRDACRDDAAAAVGIVGLLATLGVAGADWFRRRSAAGVAA